MLILSPLLGGCDPLLGVDNPVAPGGSSSGASEGSTSWGGGGQAADGDDGDDGGEGGGPGASGPSPTPSEGTSFSGSTSSSWAEGDSSSSSGDYATSSSSGGHESSSTGGVEPTDDESEWAHDIGNQTPERVVTLGDGTIVVAGHREGEVVFVGLDTEGKELFNHGVAAADYGLTVTTPSVLDIEPLYWDELVLVAGAGALRAHPASLTIPWWHHSIVPGPLLTWAVIQAIATSPDGKVVVESWAPDVLTEGIMRLDPDDGTVMWESTFINDGLYGAFVTGLAVDDGDFGVLVATYQSAQGVMGGSPMRRYEIGDGTAQPNLYSQWGMDDYAGISTRCMEILGDGSLLAVVDGPTPLNAQIQRWSPTGTMVAGDTTGSAFGRCEIATTDGASAFVLSNLDEGGRLWGVSESTTATLLLPYGPYDRVDVTADNAGGVVVLDGKLGGGTVRRFSF